MLVDVHSSSALTVVLLARYENANQRALACRLASKHRDFDSLIHVFEDVAVDRNFCEELALKESLAHLLNHDLSVLVARHVKKDG